MSARFSVSSFFCCYVCLLVVLPLLHLCVSYQNYDDVLCMDGERQALLEFKHGLIDETDRLASWVGDKSDCCKWEGIACDHSTGHVRRIHLPALNGQCGKDYMKDKEYREAIKQRLRGNLSSSLLQLKQLRLLDLSCNNFGKIQVPSFIGSLGDLRYLNLSNSNFGGSIPPRLGNLSKLHTLCLGSSYFPYESSSMMNMQWLSSLRKLHHLDLSGVDLSKAIDWFQVINTLPSLVRLHMSRCQLLHINPGRVSNLNITSLSLFDISNNDFHKTSVPRWIFSITSLVSLDISFCGFHESVASSNIDNFHNMTSLESLKVKGNSFMNSSLVLEGLSRGIGSNLILLDISSCGVSSSNLDSLGNMTSLLSLDLSENQLTKTIPKLLCNFCDLRDVDLSLNNFQDISLTYLLENFFKCNTPALESLSIFASNLSSHLPSQLGLLVHLENLRLDYNNIVGTIPDSIGRLSFLRTLDLGNNLISGPIPNSIGQLSSLEVLKLSKNQLNGGLPESLGQLSKLEESSFSTNFLTGMVTESHFVELLNLKKLQGEGNNLTLRVQLANWTPPFQLHYLNLNSWNLGPQIPLWLESQKELIELKISNTGISSPIPESFWRSLPNLKNLDMSRNHIPGSLTLLGIPITLDILDLSSNKFMGKLPEVLNGAFPLVLDLADNFFTGSLHHMLCTDGVKVTQILNLGNNSLSGIIPDCWDKWQKLSFLNLENNNLDGGIPRTLGSLYNLISLNLHGNKLVGKLPTSLMNLSYLEVLQLGGNGLDENIPSWFGTKFSSLRILNLRSNNYGGRIPTELCYLTHIQILDFADNKLMGDIPRCFSNFSVLSGKETTWDDQFTIYLSSGSQTKEVMGSDSLVTKGHEYEYTAILSLMMLLDLSGNNLVGHIPSELTALVELRSLNLSRNQLTGRIPEKIGDMKQLESFDLSLNNLCGELPMSLSRLNFLSNFNVSYNNLTGRIPSSTQLQRLNESCYIGNKLCGDPLTQRCIQVEAPGTHHEEDDDGSHGADWALAISTVLGFIAGFWVIVVPLIVSRSWRIAFFRFLTEQRVWFYDVRHNYCFNMFSK